MIGIGRRIGMLDDDVRLLKLELPLLCPVLDIELHFHLLNLYYTTDISFIIVG